MAKAVRAALYVRVSRDSQTTENQRIVLTTLAGHRGLQIVKEYEDAGISGGKGRDKRPAFDQMLKDAVRRRFDVCLVWSMDRLGRSVLHVAQAMAELDAAGVALISEQQGVDGTSPFGKAMMQMATVFAELERSMIRSRVRAAGSGSGRRKEDARTPVRRSEGRGGDPSAALRRSWHTEGCQDRWLWQRYGSEGEAGDGRWCGGRRLMRKVTTRRRTRTRTSRSQDSGSRCRSALPTFGARIVGILTISNAVSARSRRPSDPTYRHVRAGRHN
jgi:DNA invertase Pin-like site-specific DNA recombinase